MRRMILCLLALVYAIILPSLIPQASTQANYLPPSDAMNVRQLSIDPASAWISQVAEFDSTTISIIYEDGDLSPGVRGFHLVIEFDPGCIQIASIIPGDLMDNYQSHFELNIDNITGVLMFDLAVLGPTSGVSGVGSIAEVTITSAVPPADCCTAFSFDTDASILRDPENGPLPAFFVDAAISHDISSPEAPLLYSSTHTESIYTAANNIRMNWDTTEDFGLCPAGVEGYYLLIDNDIGGIPDPAVSYDSFTPWSPDSTEYVTWFNSVADGTWYIHIVSYDRVGNYSAVDTFGPIYIEATPPESITHLTALTTENVDLSIDLTWVNPSEHFAGVKIYRQGFRNYPEYDDPPNPGAEPAWPIDPNAALAAGWVEVYDGTGIGYTDHPPTRDFYYYSAFAYNNVPLYSATSPDAQSSSLNYWLGDLRLGGGNVVDIYDVLYISLAYNTIEGEESYNNSCDIGPTVDYSRSNRPSTDNQIDFYDLLLLAWNYENAFYSKDGPVIQCSGDVAPSIELTQTDDLLTVRVQINNNPGCLLGASARLCFGAGLDYLDSVSGDLWHGVEHFLIDSERDGYLLLDAVGLGDVSDNDGCFATARFRITNPLDYASSPIEQSVVLDQFMAAGSNGEDLGGLYQSQSVAENPPSRTQSLDFTANPNPTPSSALICYRLHDTTGVRIAIYDAAGRLIKLLVDRNQAAGVHTIVWDGFTASGTLAPPGIYFIHRDAGGAAFTRKLIVVR